MLLKSVVYLSCKNFRTQNTRRSFCIIDLSFSGSNESVCLLILHQSGDLKTVERNGTKATLPLRYWNKICTQGKKEDLRRPQLARDSRGVKSLTGRTSAERRLGHRIGRVAFRPPVPAVACSDETLTSRGEVHDLKNLEVRV